MRAAAFVDAGYLYSAGSKLLTGTALPRNSVQLDLDATLAALRQVVHASSRNTVAGGVLTSLRVASTPTVEMSAAPNSGPASQNQGRLV